MAAEAGQGLLGAVSSYAKGDMGGVFKSAKGLLKVASGGGQKADQYAKATRTSPADVVSRTRWLILISTTDVHFSRSPGVDAKIHRQGEALLPQKGVQALICLQRRCGRSGQRDRSHELCFYYSFK